LGAGKTRKEREREGKNTEPKATTRRRKAIDEEDIRRRINGAEGGLETSIPEARTRRKEAVESRRK
jgi:hypothetical protein